MKKRLNKILLAVFLAFFVSNINTNAKKMTYQELGQEVLSKEQYAGFVYVVGEYAFTSRYQGFNIQDVMLASANSITVDDINSDTTTATIKDKTKEMTIYHIRRTNNGWEIADNLVGNGTAFNSNAKVDIKYIDYKYIAEESKIDNLLGEINDYTDKLGANSDFQNSNYSKDLSINKINNNRYELKGLLLKKPAVSGFNDNHTGYYMAFALNIPELNDNSTLTISDGKYTKTFNSGDFKTDSNNGTAVIWPVDPESKTNTITITLDLDGTGNEYGTTKYEIIWDEELIFQEDSKASINSDLTEAETQEVKEKLDYEKTEEDTYSISGPIDKTYTLSGDVVLQNAPDKHFAATDPKGYYALIKITDDEFIPGKTTIVLPCKSCTDADSKKTIKLEDNSLSFLMALDKEAGNKTFEITIDLDGEEDAYLPVSYTIDYNGVNFKQRTEVSMSISSEGVNRDYGYSADPSSIKLDNNVLSDTVPLDEGVTNTSLGNGENLTKYYVPIKLDITGKNSSTKIYVNDHETTDTTLLLPVSKSKQKTEKFTIKVDNGEGYIPYEVSISYEDLLFQEASTVMEIKTITSGVSFTTNWDLSKQDSELILDGTGNERTLKGKVKEQKVDGEKKFYFAFQVITSKTNNPTIKVNASADNGKVIEQKEDTSFPNKKISYLYELPETFDDEKEITVTVDLDGDGNAYAPKTYTIKLNPSDANLVHLYTISFEYIEGYEDINVYEDETPKVNKPTNTDYVKFAHWIDTTEKSQVDLSKPINKDVTVSPYYDVYLSDYINSYYGDGKFKSQNMIVKNSDSTYTFEITKEKLDLNNLSETKLEDAFKGILTDLKLPSITVNEEIVTDANNVITNLTKDMGSYHTYDDLLNAENKNITLKVNGTGDSYKLHDGDKEEYTFNFTSNFRVVKNKADLAKALTENVARIIIDDNITDLDAALEAKKDVTIEGNGHTLTSTATDAVLKVSANVTINNLKLNDNAAQELIHQEDGTLNIDTLEVVNIKKGDNGNAYAAIDVESGTLTVSKLTFADETYDNPAVRAKEGASITLNRTPKGTASPITYQEILTYEERKKLSPDKEVYDGDLKQDKAGYQYKHYYNNSSNEDKWYKITFQGDMGVVRAMINWNRYIVKGESFTESTLPDTVDKITKYNNGGYNYTVGQICLREGYSNTCKSKIIEFDAPTGDTTYYIGLSGELNANAKEVANAQALYNALNDAGVNNIIVTGDIDLTTAPDLFPNGVLTITKDNLDLESKVNMGEYKGSITGKIVINAQNVSIERLSIKGKNTGEQAEGIITVKQSGFNLFQGEIADVEGNFKNAIVFDLASPKASVSFIKFTSTNLKSFIEFKQIIEAEADDGFETSIVGNDFFGSTSTKEFVVLDNLDNTSHAMDLAFKQSSFKFANEDDYALMIKSTPTGSNPVNFHFGIPSTKKDSAVDKVRIGITVTADKYDASSITFNAEKKLDNLEVHYIEGTEDKGVKNPHGDTYNAKLEIKPSI